MNSNRPPRDLQQIQRWMQAVITHPQGVEAGLGSDEARTQIDVPVSQVGEVVDRSRKRTSVERLEVYANAYYARLLECLRDEFPALVHAASEEVFDGLAFEYLLRHPSTSYTLGDLGKKFPTFLEETRPVDDHDDPGAPSWPDFVIDMARLERTYAEVFDGLGTETSKPLSIADASAILPDRWPDARLVCVPCLRLLALRYPVHEYATAVRKKEDPAMPEPRDTWLAVSRIDYVVRRWTLTQTQFDLLRSLMDGTTVGRAIEQATLAAVERSENVDAIARDLREWFQEWSAIGLISSIELPNESDLLGERPA
jgi:hypothetical protein